MAVSKGGISCSTAGVCGVVIACFYIPTFLQITIINSSPDVTYAAPTHMILLPLIPSTWSVVKEKEDQENV